MSDGLLSLASIAPRVAGPQGADRGFVGGRSGSGKTVLMSELLKLYGPGEDVPKPFRCRVVIIDPNDSVKYPAARIAEDPNDCQPTKTAPTILYRPGAAHRDSADSWNAFWHRMFYANGEVLVYCDETFAMSALFRVSPFGGNYLRAYLTRGRSRGKAAIFAAQRPANIPRDIIGQAEWFYVFDLPIRDDRREMAYVIGETSSDGESTLDRDALERYEFWHLNPNYRKPFRMQLDLNARSTRLITNT